MQKYVYTLETRQERCRFKDELFSIHVVVDFIRLTLGLIFYFLICRKLWYTWKDKCEYIVNTYSVNVAGKENLDL